MAEKKITPFPESDTSLENDPRKSSRFHHGGTVSSWMLESIYLQTKNLKRTLISPNPLS